MAHGGLGVETSDPFTSSVEKEVERLFEEGGSSVRSAADDGDVSGLEDIGEDLREDRGRRWGEFRGLQNDGVSSRDGGDEGAEGKL